MTNRFFGKVFFLLSLLSLALNGFGAAKPAAPTPSPAASPSPASTPAQQQARAADILQDWTTIRFQEDGSNEREEQFRVRINNADGVRQMQDLTFPHDTKHEKIELRYLRVEKPDGSTQTAGAEAVKEVPIPAAYGAVAQDHAITRITAPTLSPGDVLDYDLVKHVENVNPDGAFWYEHDFLKGVPVADERLTIEVPASRPVVLHSFDPNFTKTEKDGRVTYAWKRSSPTPVFNQPGQERKGPDVQMTAFANWQALGDWYAKIVDGAIGTTPSDAVKTKALELTKGLKTDKEKASALYDFVSEQITTEREPIEYNGYQLHSVDTILTGKSGNIAEKNALFEAMLTAVGIPHETVMLGASRIFDPTIPIPTQFDHVVTRVKLNDQHFWLETSLDVAPFGLLNSRIRGIKGLLVATGGKSEIVTSPADPPFAETQTIEMDGTVSDVGKLTKMVHYKFRGDKEVGLRYYFHKLPQAKWKSIAENLTRFDGIRGTVESVKPGDVMNTHEPFAIDIEVTEPVYLNWSAEKDHMRVPMPFLEMPGMPLHATAPAELGTPLEQTVKLTLKFPAGYKIVPPHATKIERSYADYKTDYAVNGNVLTVTRVVRFKEREVPASLSEDYNKFNRAIEDDETATLEADRTTPAGVPQSASADELQEAAQQELRVRQTENAIQLLQRVLQLDPHHQDTYYGLAQAYEQIGQYAKAEDALRKQIAEVPKDEKSWRDLGAALTEQRKFDEALAVYDKILEMKPDDGLAHRMRGSIFLDQGKYAQAIPELEKAEAAIPNNPLQQEALAKAYLYNNQTDDALRTYAKITKINTSPEMKLTIANELLSKGAIDPAQWYTEQALKGTNQDLLGIEPEKSLQWQLTKPVQLAACWDTLGWIYFQRNALDKAEPLLRASWDLAHDPETGKRLAQVYDKMGKADQAGQIRAVLGTGKTPPETAYPVGKIVSKPATADFYVILAPGDGSAQVQDVHFIGGSEALKGATDKVRAIDFGKVFPDSAPSKIIRRGTLTCPAKGDCTFTFLPPQAVKSLQD